MDISDARAIARGWHSPSPHDSNITALSHGVDDHWTVDGLVTEVERNIAEIAGRPWNYDDADACLAELRALRDWAVTQ